MIGYPILFFIRRVHTGWLIKSTMYFLLVPFSVLLIVGYYIEYESIKLYVLINETWYFQMYRNTVLEYVFVIFVVLCLALALLQVYRWHSSSNTNRERMQTRIIFMALLFFGITTLIIDVIIPNWDFYLMPPMVHIIGIPPIFGMLYALTDIRFHRFPKEIVSEFVIKKLPAIVIFIDARGQVFGVNHSGQRILGYGGIEIRELALEMLFASKNDGHHMMQLAREGKPAVNRTIGLLTKEGESVTACVSCVRINDRFKKFIGLALIAPICNQMQPLGSRLAALKQNEKSLEMVHRELKFVMQKRKQDMGIARAKLNNEIDEKKQSELQINHSLKEHTALIREMHHRVKNNLQIIISLTNFGTIGNYTDSVNNDVFLKIIDRLRHISTIHDVFYASPLLSKIHFGQYLENVIATHQRQNHDNHKLVFKLHATNELLSVNHALPCGILVNELIKNALKHAFKNLEMDADPSEITPVIALGFSKQNGQYVLIVRDNGTGMPENWMDERASGAGLYLVDALVNNYLKGSLTVVNSFGTHITVTFPGAN